jgi:hypothetical protein
VLREPERWAATGYQMKVGQKGQLPGRGDGQRVAVGGLPNVVTAGEFSIAISGRAFENFQQAVDGDRSIERRKP